ILQVRSGHRDPVHVDRALSAPDARLLSVDPGPLRAGRVMATIAPTATANRDYRGGRYKTRSVGSGLVLYGLILALALWLIGPFVWLLVTSISYQRNLMARPLSFVPPAVTLDNYRMVLGLGRCYSAWPDATVLRPILARR